MGAVIMLGAHLRRDAAAERMQRLPAEQVVNDGAAGFRPRAHLDGRGVQIRIRPGPLGARMSNRRVNISARRRGHAGFDGSQPTRLAD
nr:hypothetical protein [Mycobacterium tilburgii]